MAFQMMELFRRDRRPDQINYHEYIQSDEWRAKAERLKLEAGYRCQTCGLSGFSATLHAHHNTYERLGNEWPKDIAILCAECHGKLHQSGVQPGRKPRMSREEFMGVLKRQGITFTNDDPYYHYERGKVIIQHIVNGIDGELYDHYNRVNIEILEAAITNQKRRAYQAAKASGNWDGYESEIDWRDAFDYRGGGS